MAIGLQSRVHRIKDRLGLLPGLIREIENALRCDSCTKRYFPGLGGTSKSHERRALVVVFFCIRLVLRCPSQRLCYR